MNVVRNTFVRINIGIDRARARIAVETAAALERGYKAVEAATDKARTSTERVAKAAGEWAARAKATEADIRSLRDETQKLSRDERKLSLDRKILANRQRELKTGLRDLASERKKNGKLTRSQEKTEEALGRQLSKVQGELTANASASRRLAAERIDLADKTAVLIRRQRELNRSVIAERAAAAKRKRRIGKVKGAAASGVRRAGSAARTGLIGAAVGTTALVGNEIRKAAGEAVEFEKTFADVAKVVDGTDEELKAIAGAAVELSSEFPITAQGFNQIIAAAGQAGIPRDELVEFGREAARVGIAFDITADQAGTALSKLRTSLHLSTGQTVSLSGSINNLSNTMAATPEEVLDVVMRVGALGRKAGGTGEEVAALGASMVAAGASSEEAATGAKNLFLALAAGDAATDKQRSAFEKLGLDSVEVAKRMQEDFGGTLVDVLQRLDTMVEKSAQAGVAMDLIGKKSLGTVGPLLGNADLLAGALKTAADETAGLASLQKEFETRSSTAANSMQLLSNQLTAIRIEVGNFIIPVIQEATQKFGGLLKGADGLGKVLGEQVATGLRRLLDRLLKLIGPPDQLGGKLTKLVDVAFSLVEVIGAVAGGISSLVETFGAGTTAVVAMTVAVGAAAGPWGLLAAAIASTALVAGNAISSMVADISGLNDSIAALDKNIANQRKRLAEYDQLEAETRELFSDSYDDDAKAQKVRAREQTGFTGALGSTNQVGTTSERQNIVNSVIRDTAREIKARGGKVSTQAIIDARKAASREFEARQVRSGGTTLVGAGDDQAFEFAKEAARKFLADEFNNPKPASGAKQGRDEAKDKKGKKGGRRRKKNPFAAVSRDVRDVIDNGGPVGDLDVLSRGVLNSVRQGKGLGSVGGGATSPAGPNITQNITNNNVTINVDARGQNPTAQAAVNRGAEAIARDGVRLTGILAAKLHAKNITRRR